MDMILLQFNVRGCEVGEQMLSNGKCKECQPGTYLLESPREPTSCKTCKSDQSYCLGGSNIYPTSGYWRSSNTTDNFLLCFNDEACLGGSGDEPQGECSASYQGFMCASCKEDYSQNELSKKCERCPSPISNAFILLLLLIVFLAFIVILVHSNLSSSNNEKNFLPVFLRILVNHLQILTLVASFDFSWPLEVIAFFNSFRPVSESQSQLFSIDCFIKRQSIDSIYQTRVGILAAIPIILVVASIIIWILANLVVQGYKWLKYRKDDTIKLEPLSMSMSPMMKGKKNLNKSIQIEDLSIDNNDNQDSNNSNVFQYNLTLSSQQDDPHFIQAGSSLKGKIVSTIIVVLFLIHPTITREMFNVFNCKDIEGVSRLYGDFEVLCYQGIHSKVAYSIALPSIIVYSLGIPMIGMGIIWVNRKVLDKVLVRQLYGFLYNGYRVGIARYWEIFIIYRKITLLFIQIFLIQRGKIVQALVTLLYLWGILVMVIFLQSYAKETLNSLECISLLTLCISIYFCVYFVAGTLQEGDIPTQYKQKEANLTMFLLIVAMQIGFFAYWVYQFLQEFKYTMKTKYPRIYAVIFSCCKERRFFAEKDLDNYRGRVIQPLMNKIDSIQTFFQKESRMYRKDLVPLYDPEIREAVDQFMQFKANIDSIEKMYSQKALNQRVEDLVLIEKTAQIQEASQSQSSQRDQNQSLKSFSSSVFIENSKKTFTQQKTPINSSPMIGKLKTKKSLKQGTPKMNSKLDLMRQKQNITRIPDLDIEEETKDELFVQFNSSLVEQGQEREKSIEAFKEISKHLSNSQVEESSDDQDSRPSDASSSIIVLTRKQKTQRRQKRRSLLPPAALITENKSQFFKNSTRKEKMKLQASGAVIQKLRKGKTKELSSIDMDLAFQNRDQNDGGNSRRKSVAQHELWTSEGIPSLKQSSAVLTKRTYPKLIDEAILGNISEEGDCW
ncbi:hypothetical protein FGO68_gene15873 [Halteria grandinella]|uniref:Transmembrane protein n=1 Tax=Halteria grandinella TaxID=5974 RepID=A0A8J8P610_HALGN|nr:hypothetical protein FGO68_gene15873 [Halteria grandinella]